MTKETPTLVDVFQSITITEEIALARRNPASIQIPACLVECFLAVVSHDVLNVLSPNGVHGLLKCIVDSACNIVRNKGDSECGVVVERAIISGVVVTRFGWMPAEWVIPRDRQEATHCVVHIEVEQNTTPEDIVMGIEPFLRIVNRNANIFKEINDTLTTLYSICPSHYQHHTHNVLIPLKRVLSFCGGVQDQHGGVENLEQPVSDARKHE